MTTKNSDSSKLIKTIWRSPQLRNILILSLLITVFFPLYSKYISHPKYHTLLVNFIEDDALRVGKHLSQTLIASKQLLLQSKLPADFALEVQEIKSDFALEKVKVFDQKGQVLYSTNVKDIGSINKRDYFHNIVTSGKAYSKLVQKSQKTAEGRVVDRDVVESYSPIMYGNRFIGAFELYYDVTQRKQLLDSLLYDSTVQMVLMAGFLIAGLLFVQMRSATIVSSRDDALDALKKSEARFRNMTSSAQNGIIEMDTDGHVAFWNQASERIFGYTSEEALGQDLHRLIAPQRFQIEFRRHFENFQKSGTGQLIGNTTEIVGLCKDGKEIPMEISIAALKSDDGNRAIGIVRDISKRKDAERRLKLGTSVITHALQGIIVTDAAVRIQLVNPAFKKLTGYSQEQVIGKNPSLLGSGKHDAQFYQLMWEYLYRFNTNIQQYY